MQTIPQNYGGLLRRVMFDSYSVGYKVSFGEIRLPLIAERKDEK